MHSSTAWERRKDDDFEYIITMPNNGTEENSPANRGWVGGGAYQARQFLLY